MTTGGVVADDVANMADLVSSTPTATDACIFTASKPRRRLPSASHSNAFESSQYRNDEPLQTLGHYIVMCDDLLQVNVRSGVVGVSLRPGSSVSLVRLSAKKLAEAPGPSVVVRQDLYLFLSSSRDDPGA